MDRKTHMIMKLSKKIAILGILSLFISVTSGCDRDIPLDFQASDFQQQLKNTGFNISSTSGQIIIKRKKGINSFNSISPDFKTIKSIKNLNVEVVQVKNSGSMDNILKNLRNHPGVAARFFSVLAEHKIPIHLVTTSEIKISAVIDEANLRVAAQALHQAFELDQN